MILEFPFYIDSGICSCLLLSTPKYSTCRRNHDPVEFLYEITKIRHVYFCLPPKLGIAKSYFYCRECKFASAR